MSCCIPKRREYLVSEDELLFESDGLKASRTLDAPRGSAKAETQQESPKKPKMPEPAVRSVDFAKNYSKQLPSAFYHQLYAKQAKYSGMSERELIHQLKYEKFYLERQVNRQEVVISRLMRTLDYYNKFFIRRTETVRSAKFDLEKSVALMNNTLYQSQLSGAQCVDTAVFGKHPNKQYLYFQFERYKHKADVANSSQICARPGSREVYQVSNMSEIERGADLSLNDAGEELLTARTQAAIFSDIVERGEEPKPLLEEKDCEDAPAVDVVNQHGKDTLSTPTMLVQPAIERESPGAGSAGGAAAGEDQL